MTMNYKKMLCIALTFVIAFSLVACGAGDPAETVMPAESTVETELDAAMQGKPETNATEALDDSREETEVTELPNEDASATEPQDPDNDGASNVTTGNSSNDDNNSGNNESASNAEKPNPGNTSGNTGADKQPSSTEPPKAEESKPDNGSTNKPTETEPPKSEATDPNSGSTNKPEKEEDKHTHSYTVTSRKDATCTATGSKTYKCSCGDEYTETIRATGHSWSTWKTTKEPTTSAEGQKSRTCSNCSKTETQSIPKKESGKPAETEPPTTEHTHKYNVTSSKDATCTSAGSDTYKCSCGDSYTKTTDPAKGHNWCSWRTKQAATTTTEGIKERNCMTCFLVETETIPKKEDPYNSTTHTHNHILVDRVLATCSSDGSETYRCNCGDSYDIVISGGHVWESVYHPEEGHYGDEYLVCACGAGLSNFDAWYSHRNTFSGEEMVLYHGSYGYNKDWIVDSPAYYETVCSRCGEVSS